MTTKYKPGDSVAFNTSRNYINFDYSTVKRVTSNGTVILENGRRFSKNGNEIKSEVCSFPHCCLADYEKAKAYDADRETQKGVNMQVQKLINHLNKRRSSDGNYHLTSAEIELIKKWQLD